MKNLHSVEIENDYIYPYNPIVMDHVVKAIPTFVIGSNSGNKKMIYNSFKLSKFKEINKVYNTYYSIICSTLN